MTSKKYIDEVFSCQAIRQDHLESCFSTLLPTRILELAINNFPFWHYVIISVDLVSASYKFVLSLFFVCIDLLCMSNIMDLELLYRGSGYSVVKYSEVSNTSNQIELFASKFYNLAP